MATQNTLTYVRKARKAKDGHDGVLYLHSWQTGAQELIFASHQVAQDWADLETKQHRPTTRLG